MTEKIFPKQKTRSLETKLFNIVLFNDDVHSFDYVIDLLMHYCEHDFIQAEQCALLTHFKGKSVVKKGVYKELKPIASALLERGLSVEIV